jgi:hypothetical protein
MLNEIPSGITSPEDLKDLREKCDSLYLNHPVPIPEGHRLWTEAHIGGREPNVYYYPCQGRGGITLHREYGPYGDVVSEVLTHREVITAVYKLR